MKMTSTIEEAFESLDESAREAGHRASVYAGIIFDKIIDNDTYADNARAAKELVAEYRELAEKAVLWHELGAETVEALYLNVTKMKALEKRLLLDGIKDWQERPDGSGPLGKTGNDVSYMGRISALAIELDQRLMEKVSEHPMEDVLADMKKQVPDRFDPEFFKAVCQSKAKLRKAFSKYASGAKCIPVTEPFVKRRASRPMELVYKRIETEEGQIAYRASMRFLNTKEKTMTFEEVKPLLTKRGIAAEVCEYFLYEACDTLRRFDACEIPCSYIEVEMIPAYLNKKNLCRSVQAVLEKEQVSPKRLRLCVPSKMMNKPTKALELNKKQCAEAGIQLAEETAKAELSQEENYEREDEIVSRWLALRT